VAGVVALAGSQLVPWSFLTGLIPPRGRRRILESLPKRALGGERRAKLRACGTGGHWLAVFRGVGSPRHQRRGLLGREEAPLVTGLSLSSSPWASWYPSIW